ncbi:MAG: hypothetical protein ACLFOY_13620 [Desulfatibacillaceae bacterium]
MFTRFTTRRNAYILAATVLTLTLASCATFGGGSWGDLETSKEVTDSFYNYQPMEGYTYYLSGSTHKPRAIIGIKNGWTLKTSRWRRFEASHETFSEKVYNMGRLRGYPNSPYGSWILDDQGNRIGVWLADQDYTTIRIPGDKTVSVHPPFEEREAFLIRK